MNAEIKDVAELRDEVKRLAEMFADFITEARWHLEHLEDRMFRVEARINYVENNAGPPASAGSK